MCKLLLHSYMLLYLKLYPYLAQWVQHEFANAEGVVHFPKGSAEHNVMEMMLQRRPPRTNPELPEAGTIAINIPSFRCKPAESYYHLSKNARKVLAHTIYTRFKVQLWEDLYNIESLQLPISNTIYDWMERHGIADTPENWETIRQMFYRQRKKYSVKKELKEDELKV